MQGKPKVLVLCTGNSARSQMGEAFLRRYAGDRFDVHSAGLDPRGINPLTVRVMNEIGYDLSEHESKSIRKYMGHVHFQYAITVCADADKNCPHALWSTGVKLHWPFDDPAAATGSEAEQLAVFRRVRDEIEAKVKTWVDELARTPAA